MSPIKFWHWSRSMSEYQIFSFTYYYYMPWQRSALSECSYSTLNHGTFVWKSMIVLLTIFGHSSNYLQNTVNTCLLLTHVCLLRLKFNPRAYLGKWHFFSTTDIKLISLFIKKPETHPHTFYHIFLTIVGYSLIMPTIKHKKLTVHTDIKGDLAGAPLILGHDLVLTSIVPSDTFHHQTAAELIHLNAEVISWA